MTIAEIEDRVSRFVTGSFLADGASALGRDDDLFAVLDSLQVLRTVVWIEEQFGVKVTDGDLTADNLGTVGRVAAFVASRVASGPGA
jgi:acyl carrier protein